jgi:hypothetical protein
MAAPDQVGWRYIWSGEPFLSVRHCHGIVHGIATLAVCNAFPQLRNSKQNIIEWE